MQRATSKGKVLHLMYLVGIWVKGIDGALELIGGVLFLAVSRSALYSWVGSLTQHELIEDPTDWVVHHLHQALSHLTTHTKLFAGGYLLGHGLVKVFLVWGGLLRGKLWAFPTAIALLTTFIGYQSYRIIHRFSFTLVALTALDVLVLLLIAREYRLARQRHQR